MAAKIKEEYEKIQIIHSVDWENQSKSPIKLNTSK
jgi:hypothetical protein